MSCYAQLKNTWDFNIKEEYNPVTMSYPEWVARLGSGATNAILESGGVANFGTSSMPFGGSNGAVVGGHVRQNPFTAMYY